MDLEPYSEFPLAGALAMRQVYTLRLGAGSIRTDGDVLPAEGWPMVRGLRVSLRGPAERVVARRALLESLANPDSSAPARMERLARLRPSEYGVALEGCREALLAATPEIFERYRPAGVVVFPPAPTPGTARLARAPSHRARSQTGPGPLGRPLSPFALVAALPGRNTGRHDSFCTDHGDWKPAGGRFRRGAVD
ncbi:MAG: hypothetical protein R3E96_05285 [Planctomycetota bacterium]